MPLVQMMQLSIARPENGIEMRTSCLNPFLLRKLLDLMHIVHYNLSVYQVVGK